MYVLYLILFQTDIRLKKCVTELLPFMLIYCNNTYKSKKIYDDPLAAFTFMPYWFVTSKMLERFHDVLLINDNVLFFDEDLNKVAFFG